MSMRKTLALLLTVAMVCSLFVSPALAAEDAGEPVVISDNAGPLFTDIDGHWAENAINRWADYGIVKGDGDGTVQPNRALKRDEVATILTRLLGLKAKAPAGTFTDVPADAWYTDAVLKCAAAGIMLGDGAGHANPESTIDRQQTIVMVARALGAKASNSKNLSAFKDGDAVADWAAPYLAALTEKGILNGLPTDDGYVVVAPENDIDRASLFALLDKAISQYVTTPTTVIANDPNKFVVINTDAGEDVTVTGTTAGIVVGAGSADDVILDNATVGTLKVDAPVDIIIKKGSSVADLDANAAAKVENNGAVTNLNTNADDVTFDGNKPAAVNTAEDVEPAKDSKGNEVTTKPTTTGGNTTTNYKYKVSVASVTGGKVTASVTRTNTANTEVTLTVTPDAQKGSDMPYVLKSLTVMNGEDVVTVTNNKFTMAAEGTYTVTAEFVQPITKAVMYVANGTDKTAADMEADGYTPVGDVTDKILKDYPYFFIGMTKNTAEGVGPYSISDFKITANGKEVTLPTGWGGAPTNIFKFASAYVKNEIPEIDPNENPDTLNLNGSAYAFVLTFKINEAEYKFSCNYRDPAKADETFYTVTFKNGNGDTVYEGVKGEKFTVPAADVVDGKYFTGWTNGETAVAAGDEITLDEANVTVTANYAEITTQTTATRPAGDPEDFDYSGAYTALGLTLENNVLTVDAKELIGAETVADELVEAEDGADYVFYGVEYTNKPAGATHAVISYGKTLTEFDDVNDKVAVGEADSSDGGTSVYNGHLIDYLPVAYRENGVWNFFEDGATFTRYIKWMKGNEVLGITKAVITLNVKPATFTVTFADSNVADQTVAYNETATKPADPTKAGYEFLGWYADEELTTEWDATAKITADTTVYAKWQEVITLTAVPYDFSCPEGTTQYITFTLKNGDEDFYVANDTVKECWFRAGRTADGEWTKDTGVKLYEGEINGEFPEMDRNHQLGWTVSRRANEASTGYYRFVGTDDRVYEVTIEIPQAIANPDNVIWGDTQIAADKPVTAIPVPVSTTPEETSTNDEDENA